MGLKLSKSEVHELVGQASLAVSKVIPEGASFFLVVVAPSDQAGWWSSSAMGGDRLAVAKAAVEHVAVLVVR